ncbi:MAG: hypothetical protein J1G01_01920 [Clostridiales bacterium]|nr:hypothetical protein [Clostridiales bacterium]
MRIFDKILLCIASVITTALILYLVVIPKPKEFTSYLALSFVVLLDGISIYNLLPKHPRLKRPKTVSARLVLWLSAVLYCCFVGVALLTEAFMLSESTKAKIIAMVFDCIFGAIGLASLVGLIWLFVEYILILKCLQHGEVFIAEFVSIGKSIKYVYGERVSGYTSSITLHGVVFKFTVDGREITKCSKRVFTWEEVQSLQKKKTFNIRYNNIVAVIDEIPKEFHEDSN